MVKNKVKENGKNKAIIDHIQYYNTNFFKIKMLVPLNLLKLHKQWLVHVTKLEAFRSLQSLTWNPNYFNCI